MRLRIGRLECLGSMDDSLVGLIADCAEEVRYGAGQTLFREGDRADHVFLIRKGMVALQIHGTARGRVTLQTVGPGEMLGWSWLIPPYEKQFTAEAIEPVQAVKVDARQLRGLCAENPVLEHELLKLFVPLIARRLQATRMQLLDIYAAKD